MKIIIIGSPGSGKSTFALKLQACLNIPLLHLDRIFHIDNENNIGRQRLQEEVLSFTQSHDAWIIDGNYMSTIEDRMDLADTIIYMNIDTNICLENIYKRGDTYKDKNRPDMAPGFKDGLYNKAFIDFVTNYKIEAHPLIMSLLNKQVNKHIIISERFADDTLIKSVMKLY